MNKQELETIRTSLPVGAGAKLAEQFTCSRQFISQVLHGEHDRSDIIGAALKLALEEQERIAQNKNQFKKLAS